MNRYKVTEGFRADAETAADYWYIEEMSPITKCDLLFEFKEPEEGYGTPKYATLKVMVKAVPELDEELRRLRIMPYEPFTNHTRAAWIVELHEPLDMRGIRGDAKRAAKREAVFVKLRERADQGDHIEPAVQIVTEEVADMIRGNNIRYIDKTVNTLLYGVDQKWFDQDEQVGRLSELIKMLTELVAPIESKISDLYKELRVAKCEALLRDLRKDKWTNNAGEPFPEEVRGTVEPKLQEHKVYGIVHHFP